MLQCPGIDAPVASVRTVLVDERGDRHVSGATETSTIGARSPATTIHAGVLASGTSLDRHLSEPGGELSRTPRPQTTLRIGSVGVVTDIRPFDLAPAVPQPRKPHPTSVGLRYSMADRVRRGLDIVGAFFAIVFFSPLLIFIAAILTCLDGGPVLFAHERIGRGGARFRCWKFRSMVWSDPLEVIHPLCWSEDHFGWMERWQGSTTSPKRSSPSCGRLMS